MNRHRSHTFCRHAVAGVALVVATVTTASSAVANPNVVDEAARPPYTIVRESVMITVGSTVSLVDAAFEFVYVPQYDSKDRRDPMLLDVPVLVRVEDTDPAKILKIANVRLEVGRTQYRPREVLLLDHETITPVPWLPDGVRIALISFNLPRKALKPRFRAHVSYDQPHMSTEDGGKLAGYVPILPDFEQLHEVMHFKRDDFMVTFTALPEVRVRRDSANLDFAVDTPTTVAVRPRHRETIAVVVEPVAPATESLESARE